MTAAKSVASFPEQQGAVWRRAVVLAVLCIVLVILVTSDGLHAALLDMLAVIEQSIARHPVLGAVAFVAFAALSAMFAFVSVAVIVPAAVFAWGEPLSLLLLWVGWGLGGVGSYGIGRLPGRAVVRWLTAGAALRRLERHIGRNAPFGLVVLLQLALPSEIPGYVLGLVRYRFGSYLVALGLAELPYALITVYLGAGIIERRGGLILVLGLSVVSLSVLAFYFLSRRLSTPACAFPSADAQNPPRATE